MIISELSNDSKTTIEIKKEAIAKAEEWCVEIEGKYKECERNVSKNRESRMRRIGELQRKYDVLAIEQKQSSDRDKNRAEKVLSESEQSQSWTSLTDYRSNTQGTTDSQSGGVQSYKTTSVSFSMSDGEFRSIISGSSLFTSVPVSVSVFVSASVSTSSLPLPTNPSFSASLPPSATTVSQVTSASVSTSGSSVTSQSTDSFPEGFLRAPVARFSDWPARRSLSTSPSASSAASNTPSSAITSSDTGDSNFSSTSERILDDEVIELDPYPNAAPASVREKARRKLRELTREMMLVHANQSIQWKSTFVYCPPTSSSIKLTLRRMLIVVNGSLQSAVSAFQFPCLPPQAHIFRVVFDVDHADFC
ncbi:hypothetical protein WR25_05467 [Diploscapter pachys]|uniref:Uncharacterized protein n=1 Tax=Diploscapter pachys TaxID=2018661 RepID=A0A2A2KMK1_9BILA|nr:hypothetical protein WR25_05467 [Diploscapter pachys]